MITMIKNTTDNENPLRASVYKEAITGEAIFSKETNIRMPNRTTISTSRIDKPVSAIVATSTLYMFKNKRSTCK
jgi:hypothetical protein